MEIGQPKFKFNIKAEQPSQIFKCRKFFASEIIKAIKKKNEFANNIEQEIVSFCTPIDSSVDINTLIDEDGDISNVQVEWSALLNNLYAKYGKDNLEIIPSMLIDKIDESGAI
ncbi:MAG TPA: hypothetical protein DDY52_02230 [Candidatus Moranbacteria bacterium]|nr:hypothetical protein [Candidatus Moranbacteria bacterium]